MIRCFNGIVYAALFLIVSNSIGCSRDTYTWKVNDKWFENGKEYYLSFIDEKYKQNEYIYLSKQYKIPKFDIEYLLKNDSAKTQVVQRNNNGYLLYNQKEIVYNQDTLLVAKIHVTPGKEFNEDAGFTFFYSYKYGVLIKREWIDLWSPNYVLCDIKHKGKPIYHVDLQGICNKIFEDKDFFPNIDWEK